jgi:hypothetical protein
MQLDETDIEANKQRLSRVDVNGRPLQDDSPFRFRVTLPGRHWATYAELRFDPSGLVREISFDLYGAPMAAQTADEYDETALYDFTHVILGDTGCADAERMPLYRFFQNVVKPTVTASAGRGSGGSHFETHDSAALPFCGVRFQYSDLFGHSRSVSSRTNRGGAYGSTTIVFSQP